MGPGAARPQTQSNSAPKSNAGICFGLSLASYLCGGIVLSLPAVVLAHVEGNKLRRHNMRRGRDLVAATLVIGYLNIIISLILLGAIVYYSGKTGEWPKNTLDDFQAQIERQMEEDRRRQEEFERKRRELNAAAERLRNEQAAGEPLDIDIEFPEPEQPPVPLDKVDRWLTQLKSKQSREVREALIEIRREGIKERQGELVDALAGCLSSSDSMVQQYAFRCLGQIAHPNVNRLIIGALTSPNRGVQREAMELLSNSPTKANANAMAEVMRTDRSVDYYLKKMGYFAEGALLAFCKDEDEDLDLRRRAMSLLADVGTSKSYLLARSLQDHSDFRLKSEATNATRRLKEKLAIPLEASDDEIRGMSTQDQLLELDNLEKSWDAGAEVTDVHIEELKNMGTTAAAKLLVKQYETLPEVVTLALRDFGQNAEQPAWELLKGSPAAQQAGCEILGEIGTRQSFARLHSVWATTQDRTLKSAAKSAAMRIME